MTPLYIQTPLIQSSSLSKITRKNIFLKMENTQPSFSFKNRGIGHLCQCLKKQGATQFISSSGGNAGLAVAYSGKVLQVPVTVVIPETTSPLMIEKIRLESAEVIVKGKDFNEAESYAKKLVVSPSHFYISPFDHPLIWEGHSTMIDEVLLANVKPDLIVLSVGGGGLYSGVVHGLQKHGLHDTSVLAVETQGAASFFQSYQAQHCIELDQIETIATSLGAKKISSHCLEICYDHPTIPKIVSDIDAVKSCFSFANDHLTLVEPACGASLSCIYNNDPILEKHQNIVVIVCGGAGVSLDLLSKWQSRFGVYNAYY